MQGTFIFVTSSNMFPSHCKKISIFRCSISKIPLLTNVFDDLQVILKVFDYNVLVKVDYGKLVGYALTQKEKKKKAGY